MTDCIEANCTVMTGSTTNGTLWIGGYDPNAPVPYWHQNMELSTICIVNSLTRMSTLINSSAVQVLEVLPPFNPN